MPISYKKLFHLLIDRGMKKGELQEKAEITASIMARLAKDQTVKSDTIGKICKALDCQPGDIMEYVPGEENTKKRPLHDATVGSFKRGYHTAKDAPTVGEGIKQLTDEIRSEFEHK